MTVKSLRDMLLGLGSDMDNFEVVFCKSLTKDGDRIVSHEENISGNLVPDDRDCFVMLGEEALQFLENESESPIPNRDDSDGGWYSNSNTSN